MDVTLSVIIPTLGRPSLAATLASCADADEIVVILDTSRGGTLPCELPANAVFAEGNFGVTGGHAGRAVGIGMATGTHLAFMDDDDVYTSGAMDLMRSAATDVPVIFRMDHYTHGILWRDPEIRFGNVSTQMYVVPNDPARFGTWTPHAPGLPEPGGDYTFIKETAAQMGGPVWRDEIISVLRPPQPTITIVTPWLNHPELTNDYMTAVSVLRTDDELIVVDNGSDPPIQGAHRLDHNSGFHYASNLGLQRARTDAVLFLNNDIAATAPGWLEQIRAALEPGVLVGPVIRYDAHGDVDGHQLPYLDGWCMAAMRDDLLELGGFDEDYAEPSYYGDNDLCLRARASGMTLREVPAVPLLHKGGATTNANGYILPETALNYERFSAMARDLIGVAA